MKSVNTGAYCKARQRLPIEMVSELTRQTAQLLSGQVLAGWRWRGRTVKLVDGTGISMPDTMDSARMIFAVRRPLLQVVV